MDQQEATQFFWFYGGVFVFLTFTNLLTLVIAFLTLPDALRWRRHVAKKLRKQKQKQPELVELPSIPLTMDAV